GYRDPPRHCRLQEKQGHRHGAACRGQRGRGRGRRIDQQIAPFLGQVMPAALELAAELAKPFEGLRLEPYHDPVGFATLGYGHLLSREPWADLGRWQAITEEEAERMLREDMASAAASVTRLVTVPLTDYQRAAL